MALIPHRGSWLGGWTPDFGISERVSDYFGQGRTQAGGSNMFGNQNQTTLVPSGIRNGQTQFAPSGQSGAYGVTQYSQPQRQVLPASTGPYTGGGNGGGNNGIPNNPTQDQGQDPYQQIQDRERELNARLDRDYESGMQMLEGEESGLRSQAGTAEGQITSDALSAKNTIQSNLSQGEQGVTDTLAMGEKEASSASKQARDLFRQTQQQNIAQLSALGLSSSSVSEALAEKLGIQTARRIAGVTDSLSGIRVGATKELSRIREYYKGKVEEVDRQSTIEKSKIQQALMSGLNQINYSREMNAARRADARSDLLYQVQTEMSKLRQQEQEFKQSLERWASQKSSQVQAVLDDPTYMRGQQNYLNTLNKSYAPQGFTYVPNVNAQNQITGYRLVKKDGTDIDPDTGGVPATTNSGNSGFSLPSWANPGGLFQ